MPWSWYQSREERSRLVVGADRLVALDPGRVQRGVGLGVDAVRAERVQGHAVGLRCGETAVLVHDVPHVDVVGEGQHGLVGRRGRRGELRVPVADGIDHELEQVGGRQVVAVLDDRRVVLVHADGRPEVAHADRPAGAVRVRGPVAPHVRRAEVAVEAPRARPHRELVVVGARVDGRVRDGRRRRGQRIHVLLQRRGLGDGGVPRVSPMAVAVAMAAGRGFRSGFRARAGECLRATG